MSNPDIIKTDEILNLISSFHSGEERTLEECVFCLVSYLLLNPVSSSFYFIFCKFSVFLRFLTSHMLSLAPWMLSGK